MFQSYSDGSQSSVVITRIETQPQRVPERFVQLVDDVPPEQRDTVVEMNLELALLQINLRQDVALLDIGVIASVQALRPQIYFASRAGLTVGDVDRRVLVNPVLIPASRR